MAGQPVASSIRSPKSGSNNFHGELFFYDRATTSYGAENPYTTLTTQVPGSNNFITYPYKPKDWRKQWGFGVGGPLLHDKLFWFYSYDQSQRNFPGTARASDPADTFAPADPVLPAGATCQGGNFTAGPAAGAKRRCCSLLPKPTRSTLAIQLPQAGAAYYTQGPSASSRRSWALCLATRTKCSTSPNLTGRSTTPIAWTLQYNRLRFSSPAGVQTQASNFYGRASFGNDFVKEDFGISAPDHRSQHQHESFSFLFQYGRDFERTATSQTPWTPNELPLSSPISGDPLASSGSAGYADRLLLRPEGLRHWPPRHAGTPRSAQRAPHAGQRGHLLVEPRSPHHQSWHRSESASSTTSTTSMKREEATATITAMISSPTIYTPPPAWRYDRPQPAGTQPRHIHPQVLLFAQIFGNLRASLATILDYAAGLLTDDWRILPNLTLTLGVRYEYEYIPPPVRAQHLSAMVLPGTSSSVRALSRRPPISRTIAITLGYGSASPITSMW